MAERKEQKLRFDKKFQMERNEACEERHELTIERMKQLVEETTVEKLYQPYFQECAMFLLELEHVRRKVADGSWQNLTQKEMEDYNENLYQAVLPEFYDKSFASPEYTCSLFGLEMGRILSMLYAELRSGIAYAFENRMDYLTILNELLIEVYNSFEEETPECKTLTDIIYWYASDYCDVFLADRIEEQLYPERSYATEVLMNADLSDERYLYTFGEYITENELKTARHLASLPEETIQKMADVYTEGYRIGFINTGKDISIKSVVNIRYCLGFERVVRRAIENFAKMGLQPVIYRAAASVITRKEQSRIGYYGAIPNKQYEYDHRLDQALFLDKRYVERKLDVLKTVYEQNKEQAALFGGPAVIETFGEKPFSPEVSEEAYSYSDVQKELVLQYDGKSSQIVNQYIKGEERSFTIIAYPVPEIGEKYPEIFDEVIRINTLDATLYEQVQQTLIDALDQGDQVHILGKGENRTDLTVNLWKLQNPEKETIFENCVADVNIPVGEVFTTPVLKGTNGVLHVSKVYLHELQYEDLELTFTDGMITDYRCGNFADEAEGKNYIFENVLNQHESLPLGEFAIGTNTTAYVAARKYEIEEKMPILIAEKTGPHFAVGDSCYSWCEDIRVYNPSGKEIVAKDNACSIKRREDISQAYFHCHTDITIPYEELEEISVLTKDGKQIILLKDGRFVLPGTEVLNQPLDEMNK